MGLPVMQRRQYLLAASTAATTFVAGCGGTESSSSDGGGSGGNSANTSENGNSGSENNSSSTGNSADGGEETQDITQRGAGEDVLENAGLVIQEHDYVEDDYSGYVEGIVENTTGETKSYVQVQVRGYDADGNQLDSYLDNTTDLQGGGTWKFEVPVFDHEEIEEYDIAVTDSAI